MNGGARVGNIGVQVMHRRPLFCPSAALGLWLIGCFLPPVAAIAGEASTGTLIAEARRSFRLDGKMIPPEIFRDFGDGDMADSGAIWVTVDVKAAIGSNLYFDDITQNGAWVIQKKSAARPGDPEETAYKYIGATKNGLVVVLTSYSGGGSGDFISLHILDIAPALGFRSEGKTYQRINLTNLRTVWLGDRWDGEIGISDNRITVVTTRQGPADESGARRTTTIEARRR
jgi:hypothetical protein